VALWAVSFHLGNDQAANMVALGAIIKTTGTVPLDLIKSTMAGMLSHKDSNNITTVNQQALDAGYSAI
jgi:Pyruvate/2-oxoacid:ferredoxin oxidoreductase gamma subunit